MVFQVFCRIVFLKVIFLAWLIKSRENYAKNCEGIRNNGCCDGFYWNATTDKCLKCLPGNMGPNCSIKCPYPSFGDQCQGNCTCSKDICDVATGCFKPTTDDRKSSPLMIETTAGGKDNTFYTRTNNTPEAKTTSNSILIILIEIFGGIAILLICIYSIVIVIDRQRDKNKSQNRVNVVPAHDSMYENVQIYLLPNE